MQKRYCDLCKAEIGFMRVRHVLQTVYPEIFGSATKDTTYEDVCHKCMTKAKTLFKSKEVQS